MCDAVTEPYQFSGPYSQCFANANMAMDKRHVYMIHELLVTWKFGSTLELGSFNGASSTAFVEAINSGSEMHSLFCDVMPTRSLMDVLRNCKHYSQAKVTDLPSKDVLGIEREFDLILVDAGHRIEDVIPELALLMRRNPLCVIAHDTSASDNGYPFAEGAALVKHVFANRDGYQCIEDARYRDGEQTHRGLFIAAREQKLYEAACAAVEKWS